MPSKKKQAISIHSKKRQNRPSVTSTPIRPISKARINSEVIKQGKKSDKSTPVATVSTTRHKHNKDAARQQYNLGSSDANANTHFYKFTGRQTQNWHLIDQPLKEYLHEVIDSGVKSVCSKSSFVNDENVQELMVSLQQRLKANLNSTKVPNKKYGDYRKVKATLTELRQEADILTAQELELEREIRKEERLRETLEDADMGNTNQDVHINIKIPGNQLNLPSIVFNGNG